MSIRYPSGFISSFYDPLKTPNAPTIGTATAGEAQVSVTFTAPSNVGGSAITSFIATARRTSNGVLFSNSGASSPITITGLVAGTAFTVTVVAVNSFGPGPASAASNSVTPTLPAIGSAFGGGFFAGQIGVSSVATHNLIVGPLSTAEFYGQWKTSALTTPDTLSDIDGPANTAAMIAQDAALHPCGQFCNDLVTGGFDDWYMPAQNEVEVCYYNLKPTTTSNSTSFGINPNAVPARASNYTSGDPAQTSAAAFQTGGAQAFSGVNFPIRYWSSTQSPGGGNDNTKSRVKRFNNGFLESPYSFYSSKSYLNLVRAVRRVPV